MSSSTTENRVSRPTRTLLLQPPRTARTPLRTKQKATTTSRTSSTPRNSYSNDRTRGRRPRSDLRDLRRSLLIVDRDGGEAAAAACQRVGGPAPTGHGPNRTPRLDPRPQRHARTGRLSPVTLERADIDGYLAASGASDLLGHRDVIEFWKSGPLPVQLHGALRGSRTRSRTPPTDGPSMPPACSSCRRGPRAAQLG